MVISIVVLAAVAAFLAGLLGAAEVGRRVGTRDLARDPEGLARGTGAAEAAVFALLGLLLAFTFAGAASRFEARRHLVTEEANAIGTAYLRLDLLPAGERADLQALFRDYVDGRLDSYRHGLDMAATAESLGQDAALQGEIWRRAVAASTAPGMPSQAAMLLLPALNAMIDITTTRWTATRNHPPVVVFAMLGVVALVGSLLVGYATSVNRRRSTLHTALFAMILTVTTYVIFDLEFPRLGMIRVTSADQVLVDLRTSMR